MTLPRRIPKHLQNAFIDQQLRHAQLSIPEKNSQDISVDENLPTKIGVAEPDTNSSAGAITGTKRKLSDNEKKNAGQNQDCSEGVALLWRWVADHLTRPYPSREDKEELLQSTGLTKIQLRNFFTNVRKRHFRPILERGRPPRSELELAILKANKKNNTKIKLKPTPAKQSDAAVVGNKAQNK